MAKDKTPADATTRAAKAAAEAPVVSSNQPLPPPAKRDARSSLDIIEEGLEAEEARG